MSRLLTLRPTGWTPSLLLGLLALQAPLAADPLAGGLSPEAFKASLSRTRLADDFGIYNSYIAAQVSSVGRFNFGAFPAGGSALAGSASFNLSYSWPGAPGTSATTIRIDGQDFTFGAAPGTLSPPSHSGDVSHVLWRYGDIQITQELSLVTGPTTGRPDTVRIRYLIDNQGSTMHDVGVRVMIDTMLAGNDAAPFRIPGVGAVTTEMIFEAPDIPSFFQVFADLATAEKSAQGTLIGPGATPPSRFGVMNWGRIQGTLFDYTPSPGSATGDSAIAVWWDPRPVQPGATADCSFLYGLGSQTVEEGQLRLGLVAPTEVRTSVSREFEVFATVENPGTTVIPGVSLTLDVPFEMSIVTDRHQVATPIGDLAPGATGQASWTVRVEPTAQSVQTSLFVFTNSTDPSVLPVTATREINLIVDDGEPSGGAEDVDLERSTFRFTAGLVELPGGLFAQQGMPLSLEIDLRDEAGEPAPGIPAELVRLTLDPLGETPILGPFPVPDEPGRFMVMCSPRDLGPLNVGVTVAGRPLNQTAVVQIVDFGFTRVTYSLAPGLHLLACPLLAGSQSWPFRGAEVAVWNAVEGRYERLSADQSAPPGQGFFVRVPFAVQLTGAGSLPPFVEAPPPGGLVTTGADSIPAGALRQTTEPTAVGRLRLEGEWNLLGNPTTGPLLWSLASLGVWVDGTLLGSLNDEATWQYVEPYSFVFDGTGYRLVFDPSRPGFEGVLNHVPVLQGFWMRRTPGPAVVEVGRLSTPASRARTAGGWAMALTATDGTDRRSVTVGQTTGRALAIVPPPETTGDGLRLTLLGNGRALLGDVRSGSGAEVWELAATAPAGRQVTLTWADLARRLPAGRQAVLVDRQTGQRLALRTRGAYSYASRGETRRLALEIGPTSGRLQLQLGPAPSRSRGAAVSLTITAAATVKLIVTSPTGRIVREAVTAVAEAGTTTLAWDGLDDAGRPAPAGLYRLLVTATGDSGELARAMTEVLVR